MRIVLDTNVLVSALITKGAPPDRLYQAWLRNEIELVTSAAQIDELADVPVAFQASQIRRSRRCRRACFGHPSARNRDPRHAGSETFSGPEGRRHPCRGRRRRSRTRGFRRQAGNSGAPGDSRNSNPHPARSTANRARSVGRREILTTAGRHSVRRTDSPGAHVDPGAIRSLFVSDFQALQTDTTCPVQPHAQDAVFCSSTSAWARCNSSHGAQCSSLGI